MKSRSNVLLLSTAIGCGPPLGTNDDVGDDGSSDSDASDEAGSESGTPSETGTGSETDEPETDETETGTEAETGETETGTEAETDETETDTEETNETETDTESESGTTECEQTTVHEGSVLLDQSSTPADFDALVCVERITGDLEIKQANVGDLEFLSALIQVDGDVEVRNNPGLSDLHGLEALEHVGGALSIISNGALIDLEGLSSLHELGGVMIAQNPVLSSVAGLQGDWHLHPPTPQANTIWFSIQNNGQLASLDGLAEVSIADAELPISISITDNAALVGDLLGLAGIVESDVEIGLTITNTPLESLVGLEGLIHARWLMLLGTANQYTSLVGLDNLVSVELLHIGICNDPEAYNHHELASLDGLESLEEIGQLQIWGNLELVDIDALAGVETIELVMISENPKLSQNAVDSWIADVEVTGRSYIQGNGTGQPPTCGFIPP